MLERISDSNFPTDAAGRVYHVGVRPGEVANRVVTVGDAARLRRFSVLLDATPAPFELVSSRGYTVITGRYKTVPLSLIAIGMGAPMMDFLIRELRHVVKGELLIVRFGSCGSLDPTFPVGSVGVPQQAISINTDYDHAHGKGQAGELGYRFSQPMPADPTLQQALLKTLRSTPELAQGDREVRDSLLHGSADFFYSTQGRHDPSFDDDNAALLPTLQERYPELHTLEMETAQLFHLASIHRPDPAKDKGPIIVAACHMVFAGRFATGESSFIDPETVAKLEPVVGRACLETAAGFTLSSVHPDVDAVWT